MAEYENHRMLTLQFRELAAFGSMLSKFVVGKSAPGTISDRIMEDPFGVSS